MVQARRELALVCCSCRQEVLSDGYLWIDTAVVGAVQRHRHAARDCDDAMDLLDFLAGPEPARWQAHHQPCDARNAEAHYRLPAAKLRTRADLLEWSAHLIGKAWVLEATDWTDVMGEGRTGGERLRTLVPAGGNPAL